MSGELVLPYPARKADVAAFVRRHHYSRRCPAVWKVAYALASHRGALRAVVMYGEPPYPSIKRAFCRRPEDHGRVAWQCRMIGAGISRGDLDGLLAFAAAQLRDLEFFWTYTLSERQAWVIDRTLVRLVCPGYSGETYARNNWLWLGMTRPSHTELFIIDGRAVHIRQNATTLTLSNIHQHYPDAREIRAVPSHAKDRWAQVLARTEQERAERLLLMKYHPQVWQPAIQPRLLARLCPNIHPHSVTA
jgi:hypothetical protein